MTDWFDPLGMRRVADAMSTGAAKTMVGRTIRLDQQGIDGRIAPFSFADHPGQARICQHAARELVHASGRGWTGWSDHFVADRRNRANVIDESSLEIDGQRLPLIHHVDHPFVGRVSTGRPKNRVSIRSAGTAMRTAATTANAMARGHVEAGSRRSSSITNVNLGGCRGLSEGGGARAP